MSPTKNAPSAATPYQLFMLVLCAWALLMLGFTSVFRPSESTRAILSYADDAVCVVFFADFLNSLFRERHKWRYFRSWGWIDLLSSIPTVDALRLGRAARVMRILRVLRGIKSARAMAHFVMGRRTDSAFLASALLTLLPVVCCSIAVLEFEVPANGRYDAELDPREELFTASRLQSH